MQSKEIGSSSTPSDVVKGIDQSSEKKKGFIDWRNLIKPMNEEKDHWVGLIFLRCFMILLNSTISIKLILYACDLWFYI